MVNRKNYEVAQPLLLSVMLALGMIIGIKIGGQRLATIVTTEEGSMGRVEEVIRFIESRYVNETDSEELVSDAIYGVMQDLDPHSLYIDPSRVADIEEQMAGSYEGLGIETIMFRDTLVIYNVLPNSPASEAEISQYDRILAVDGIKTSGVGENYDRIRELISGQEGKELRLEIEDLNSANGKKEVTLSIANIQLSAVPVYHTIADSIGYVKVEKFSRKVYKEFMEAIETLQSEDLRHLIIDLRQNPGGYLPEATKMLNQLFKEKDQLLVYTEGTNESKKEYKTTGKSFLDIDKIVVLIDEGSASGSEIIAGVIQDWDRGLIIGRRSYGKGLVQEQFPLRSGGALRLTVAKYYMPSGRSIQRDYTNKDEYRNEFDTRYYNGELTDESKIKTSDTTEYLTKKLSRKVYAGGGIVPDIFVPMKTIHLEPELEVFRKNLNAFSYHYLRNQSDLKSTPVESLDLESDDLVSQFLQYCKDEDIAGADRLSRPDYRPYMNNSMISQILKQVYGKTISAQVTMSDDEVLNEAIRAIQKRELFAELN